MRLKLGISPCPNDTFAFHGLLAGAVDARGLELDFALADVEALNQRLALGQLDAGKASFHAALHLADRYGVLPAGAALGRGNGPLLLSRVPGARPTVLRNPLILAPGAWTTATLLFRLFHGPLPLEQVPFDRIIPALEQGEADFGVCIHEARFTYREHGLHLVEDLGARWEAESGAPLPLGGILARLDLPAGVPAALAAALRDSIDYARSHPEAALATMRRHAQELNDAVLWRHVELYVTAATRDLDAPDRHAIERLAARARAAGILPASGSPLVVFSR